MPVVTELGQLIDSTEEEFRKYCEDKDVGYLSSFQNLMIQMFNEVKQIKDDLVLKMRKKPEYERTHEEHSTLEGLYSKLLRIEQRVFILREVIKNRQIKS